MTTTNRRTMEIVMMIDKGGNPRPRNRSASGRRRPHPARTARIVCTGLAATMTLGTMTALTLTDTSTASGTSNSGTFKNDAAGLASGGDGFDQAPAVGFEATTAAVATPTTILIVRRVHRVTVGTTVPAPDPRVAVPDAAPMPAAATGPENLQTFAPKPAARSGVRQSATSKVRLRVARPKVNVRRAKPATRSS